MKLSPSAAREVRRVLLDVVVLDGEQDAAPSLADMARRAKFLLDGVLRERRRPVKHLAPGKTRDERRKDERAREREGKDAARQRAEGICEWHTAGRRCYAEGTDGDHVLGGRWKAEMEALPNGEGFMWECRFHHDIKHGPERLEALEVGKEHAIRIGSRRLLRLMEAAIRRYEAKHGRTT